MIKSNRELSAVLAGLRLLQRSAIPGTSVYDVPDSVTLILDNAGQVKPLDPDEIDSLCERLNVDPAADLEQLEPGDIRALVGEAIRILGSAVAHNADEFENDLCMDLADLCTWFGQWRQDAWKAIENLRRVNARLSSDVPMQAERPPMVAPRPVMAAAFEEEASSEHKREALITLKSGVTHTLPKWYLETDGNGWRIEASPIPGAHLVLDVSDIATVLFMNKIPEAMVQSAYGMFPTEVEESAMPRTLDD